MDLPESVWALVFSFLADAPPEDKLAVMMACKSFRAAAQAAGAFWRCISFTDQKLELLEGDPIAAAGWQWQRQHVLELGLAAASFGAQAEAVLLGAGAAEHLDLRLCFQSTKERDRFGQVWWPEPCACLVCLPCLHNLLALAPLD